MPDDARDAQTWNPTAHDPISRFPIAVLIETKRSGGDRQKAEYQVGIWASALFARFRQLFRVAGTTPSAMVALPLLVVDGSSWTFLVATTSVDEGQVVSGETSSRKRLS